jgi:hypothetical protein
MGDDTPPYRSVSSFPPVRPFLSLILSAPLTFVYPVIRVPSRAISLLRCVPGAISLSVLKSISVPVLPVSLQFLPSTQFTTESSSAQCDGPATGLKATVVHPFAKPSDVLTGESRSLVSRTISPASVANPRPQSHSMSLTTLISPAKRFSLRTFGQNPIVFPRFHRSRHSATGNPRSTFSPPGCPPSKQVPHVGSLGIRKLSKADG